MQTAFATPSRGGWNFLLKSGLQVVFTFGSVAFNVDYIRQVPCNGDVGQIIEIPCQLLARQAKGLPDDACVEAEAMLRREREILDRMGRVMGRKIAAEKIRIHGDYHLGQVLDTGRDFVIIDFEGEPARPISERRLKRSALRDVAGMLRSFHYAAHTALAQEISVRGVDVPAALPWAELWTTAISRIFLESYLATANGAAFLPADAKDFALLLDAYLLDKAVYEVAYELNNRPDWIRVPLRGIVRILDARDEGRPTK